MVPTSNGYSLTPLLEISFMNIFTSEVFHSPEEVLEMVISVAAKA